MENESQIKDAPDKQLLSMYSTEAEPQVDAPTKQKQNEDRGDVKQYLG